jgi:hypothetical protein
MSSPAYPPARTPATTSKQRLVNLATPDTNIAGIKAANPQLHTAIANLGSAAQQVINSTFPPSPTPNYRGRIILPGVLVTSADVLVHPYHVVLPLDPSGYWTFTQINLVACYITCKVQAATSALSIDILVSQKKGTTPYKSLFQPGFNPMLPVGVSTTHNVMFAIGNLFQDDIGRVDVLNADGTSADVELVLVGNYSLTETTVP